MGNNEVSDYIHNFFAILTRCFNSCDLPDIYM